MSSPQDPWQNPNPQSPQAYPAFPPPAYPGGAAMPPPAQRPPMPSTVKNAVNLMFAGMALSLVTIIIGFATLSSSKDQVRRTLQDKGTYTETLYNTTVNILIAGIIIGGLIGAGFWLWMALICRAGRNWGRIVSTVFFGIGALFTVIGLTQDSAALNKILSLLPILIGLVTIILLWNKQSTPYFKPEQANPYGYAPGQAPYGQPGQPGPYGQQPPYGQG